MNVPRFAASVEISKRMWFLMSLLEESGSSIVPFVCEPAMSDMMSRVGSGKDAEGATSELEED